MNKYKICLEYDGTGYRGWQSQKNAKSIQGTLIAAAEKLLGTAVNIQGAGRTDAGVHALHQVAHLECGRKINCATLQTGLKQPQAGLCQHHADDHHHTDQPQAQASLDGLHAGLAPNR